MTARLLRAVAVAARVVTRASTDWQCSVCSRWFTSDKPSQTCPLCS